jgi:hypothetical protein
MFPSDCEALRMEYYAARLHVSQNIKGKDLNYDSLTETYQISFIGGTKKIWDDDVLVHSFKLFDPIHNISFNGRISVIAIELAKVAKIGDKPVELMDAMERWAVFFVYCNDRKKRAIINKILQIEKGIAMAGDVMMHISRDWAERCRLESEYKYEVDLQSATVDARRAADEARNWQTKYNKLQRQAEAKFKQAAIEIERLKREIEQLKKP